MAAGPENKPFSPSDFLDLPPTPQPDGDGGHGPDLLQGDDLVLPFITRVLMEEEEEDIVDDDPALLQAQQTLADILSATAAASSTAKSDGSVPPFPDAPAFDANATWPYDPVELSYQLLVGVVGGQHGGSSSESSLLPAAAAAGDDDNRNRVTMEMLNLAFLKGMQEANKFLPTTTNSLLAELQPRETASNGRGRKNRHSNWTEDNLDLEAETGRSCKVMASAETEEVVDEFILNGYQSLLDKMMDMSITMDREAEKNTRKQKGKGSITDEAVDLRTLLIHCAQAAAAGNRLDATELLAKIKQRSSPTGDATQRLAHCFAKGLEARLAGTGSQVYKSLVMSNHTSAVEFYKAYQLYLAVCCFQMMAFKFSNMTICKAISGRKKVHIVDYGGHYGFQWPTLLGYLGTREGGAPEVRITGIGHPQPGFRPAARMESTGRRLGSFARQCGVPFKFHSIVANWETVCVDDLNIQPDEVLIVNSLSHFGKLSDDESGDDLDSPSPRDRVLSNIRRMRPDVFILCVENSSYNAPFFATRFREALFYYSAMFDMMDSTAPRDNAERIRVEQELFGRCALNAIACEGSERVERPETYRQWQVRNDQAGMRQLPLDAGVVKAVSEKVKDGYHKDFFINVDQQWLLQGWKGRVLYAMSTWVANDATS